MGGGHVGAATVSRHSRTMRLRAHVVGALGALGALVAISACAEDQPAPATPDAAFAALAASVRHDALEASASAEHLRAIDDAAQHGVVAPEAMRQALLAYGECLTDAGWEFTLDPATQGPPEFPTFAYTSTGPANGDATVMDTCWGVHAGALDTLYQNQPGLHQAADRIIEAHRADILACLREADIDIDDGATLDELKKAVALAFAGVDPDQPETPVEGWKHASCTGFGGLTPQHFVG